jgi:hypothetical protein
LNQRLAGDQERDAFIRLARSNSQFQDIMLGKLAVLVIASIAIPSLAFDYVIVGGGTG